MLRKTRGSTTEGERRESIKKTKEKRSNIREVSDRRLREVQPESKPTKRGRRSNIEHVSCHKEKFEQS